MIYIFLLFLGFIFGAFFSGSETGFMSSNNVRIKHLSIKGNLKAKFLEYCHKNQLELLTDMLIGSNLSTVLSAVTVTVITAHFFSNEATSHAFEGFYALFLIVFAELIPKIMFRKYPTQLLMFFVPAYSFIVKIFKPFIFPLKKLPGLARIESVNTEFFSKSELKTIVDHAGRSGHIEPDEKEMIHGIFSFGETRAREIMTPRVDIKALDKDMPIDEMFDKATEWHFTRYPVVDEDLDHILGFVHIFDILNAVRNNISLKSIIRDVYYVPGTKMIDDIFKEMRRGTKTLTIVLDEYGGTSGLITYKDIVEEVVGEIVEIHDKDTPLIHKNEDGTLLVDGRADLEEISEIIKLKILEALPETETIGGFVQGLFGSIPKPGESIEYNGFRFLVVLADKRKLIRLRITPTKYQGL